MGQALSSETHSIPGGDGYKYWVGLNMKAFRGRKKTIYNGILLGPGPRWGENVVVKAFSNLAGTKENWRYEVVKADVTKQMIAMYKEECQDCSEIRVVSPSIVQMDKVSKVNKWLSDRRGNTTICRDDWVSVEEFVPGQFKRFSPWSAESERRIRTEANHLSVFSHFTFLKSEGNFVACDFQGVINEENGKCSFIITDAIIHSCRKEYGPFDEGDYGMTEFFKFHMCNQVCRGWPVPQPLTPPPPFSSLPLSPPPAFEDIVFPTPTSPHIHPEQNTWRRTFSVRGQRRRHATGESPHMRISNTETNMISLCNDPQTIDRRERSSSINCSIQRSRLQSDRMLHCSYNLPSLVIPSAPPAYEDCIDQVEPS